MIYQMNQASESEESLGSIHYLSLISFGVIVGIIAIILLRSREST